MLACEFFTSERVAQMRREIIDTGFFADPLLGAGIDSPVFGVNLACAYPFPAPTAQSYLRLAEQLARLDENAYVYPVSQTHITIATFISFFQNQSPATDRLASLNGLTRQITAAMEKLFARGQPKPITTFNLSIEQPLISRKAAILPMSNPTEEIQHIRQRVASALAEDEPLRNCLEPLGLNLPPLIHSSIMRFKRVPENSATFLCEFDKIANITNLGSMEINELLITIETKPYMRGGTIIDRFPLAARSIGQPKESARPGP